MVFTQGPSAHVRSLATGVGLGTIFCSSGITRFVQGGDVNSFRYPPSRMKTDIPFTSKDGGCYSPTSSACIQCGREQSTNTNQISLHGGAMQYDPTTGHGISRNDDLAFLTMYARIEDASEFLSSQLQLADNLGGQFNLFWCSFNCMRQSLNELIDRLESGLQPPSTSTSPQDGG